MSQEFEWGNGQIIDSVADEARVMLRIDHNHTEFEDAAAVFIHSACDSHLDRTKLVKKMIDKYPSLIDRWGACWKNRDIRSIEPPDASQWYDTI